MVCGSRTTACPCMAGASLSLLKRAITGQREQSRCSRTNRFHRTRPMRGGFNRGFCFHTRRGQPFIFLSLRMTSIDVITVSSMQTDITVMPSTLAVAVFVVVQGLEQSFKVAEAPQPFVKLCKGLAPLRSSPSTWTPALIAEDRYRCYCSQISTSDA
jgi:hypothetical protein